MDSVNRKPVLKVCVVCGDRANGYNFNVISCESCKAFFRRNALRKKIFRCTFQSKCDISVLTRRFCQKCRLEKCLVKGMNKNLILSDDEKLLMKQKLKPNQLKQQDKHCRNIKFFMENSELVKCLAENSSAQGMCDNIANNSDINVEINSNNFGFEQNYSKHNNALNFNIQQENIYQGYSGFTYKLLIEEKVENLIKCDKIELNSDRIFEMQNTDPVYNEEVKLIGYGLKGLTCLEQNRLQELDRAFTKSCERSTEDLLECVDHSDILRLIDKGVRRLTKMINRIESFKSLCLLDQMALMKAACTQIIILRSILNYNFDEQLWSVNKGQTRTTVIKLDFFKKSSIPTIYEAHKCFMKHLSEEWESDINILNLLSVIILFSSNGQDIIHKQLISYENKCHRYLLQRYLDTKYQTNMKSIDKFKKLENILKELNYLNEENLRWHLEARPEEIGPLLIEIFNFK